MNPSVSSTETEWDLEAKRYRASH